MPARPRLVQDLARVLLEHPAASMDELGELVGVSRATIYRHFPNRGAVLTAVVHASVQRWRLMHDDLALIDATDGDRDTLAHCLDAYLMAIADVAQDHGFALTTERHLPDVELTGEIHRLMDTETRFFAACQRVGVLRDDVPGRWIGRVIFGAMIGVREAMLTGDIARRDVEQLLRTTVLHGLTPQSPKSDPPPRSS